MPKSLNKYQTKLYVEYATSISSTTVVAKELNLEPSRVSEMKSGRRRLSYDEASIIKEKYGVPLTSSSMWMVAEYMELTTFRETIINNGLELNFIKLVDYFNSKQFYLTLFGTRIKNHWEYKDSEKLSVFQRLINDVDFVHWCDEVERLFSTLTTSLISDELITNLMYEKDIQGISCIDGILRYDLPTTKPLPTYAELLTRVDSKLSFPLFNGSKNDPSPLIELILINKINKLAKNATYDNLIAKDKTSLLGYRVDHHSQKQCSREYVISGKVVWEGINFQLAKPIKGSPTFFNKFKSDVIKNANEELKDTIYEYSRESLIYSEQYKYYLLIELTGQPGKIESRKLLIHIPDRSLLFESIKEIFEELGIVSDYQISAIKRSLAENGAFVPTATYIN